MKHDIDARGLTCPQPVILTRTAMKENSEIEILVDNQTALENIRRLAESSGWNFEDTIADGHYKITITSSGLPVSDSPVSEKVNNTNKRNTDIIVFSSDKMGRGDDELGSLLLKAFIHTLTTLDRLPSTIIFYNTGVKLTVEGSGVTDDIEVLHEKGVGILICGTCLNYFNISDKVKTGTISNMFDILNTMNNADKIINP